eukprot:TRINITY_DN35739_c0_g1_i1.p1 TRINITY_DN35739_c0_g1~~TRINITY_DN35739_c0_g1_i1.p1  ORF type:complete len:142 (+),score=33.79 TRINITY_DN35739_c0_g1_i1:48-473(+)
MFISFLSSCSSSFFFFKQKTAYEMLRSLVGSEMCIRDRSLLTSRCNSNYELRRRRGHSLRTLHPYHSYPWFRHLMMIGTKVTPPLLRRPRRHQTPSLAALLQDCLLYTSDAADEEDSVDLGGRRIIKKKKIEKIENSMHNR